MTESNSRTAQRLKVLKSAKAVFNKNSSVVDCTVRDMSETGARIVFKDHTLVPDEFRFLLTQDNTIRDVKIMWRKGGLVGIKFMSDAVRAPSRKF